MSATNGTWLGPFELFPKGDVYSVMLTFVLWLLLFFLCWPLALVALLLYPLIWLLLLPFRLVGIAVGGVLRLVWEVVTLPVTILKLLTGGNRRAA